MYPFLAPQETAPKCLLLYPAGPEKAPLGRERLIPYQRLSAAGPDGSTQICTSCKAGAKLRRPVLGSSGEGIKSSGCFSCCPCPLLDLICPLAMPLPSFIPSMPSSALTLPPKASLPWQGCSPFCHLPSVLASLLACALLLVPRSLTTLLLCLALAVKQECRCSPVQEWAVRNTKHQIAKIKSEI